MSDGTVLRHRWAALFIALALPIRTSAMAVQVCKSAGTRRNILAAACGAAVSFRTIDVKADDSSSSPIVLTGTVDIQKGALLADLDYDPDDAALFITVKRGGRVSNGLDLARGNVLPPVAAVKFEDVEFPFNFAVREKDIFAEARGSLKSWSDVTVVGRFDNDGVVSTRDPYDLVGSVVLDAPSKPADFLLMPRGGVVQKIMGKK